MNLHDLLDRSADIAGASAYLIQESSLTYGDAAHVSRRLAAAFRRLGLGAGGRVLIVTGNRPEIATAAFAASRLGAVFSVLHNATKPFGLREIVAQCSPTLVLLDETTADLLSVFTVETIIWCGEEDACPSGALSFDRLVSDTPPLEGSEAAPPGAPVCLVYTSGSTGKPRGVVLSHQNILFAVDAILKRLRYCPDDVVGVFLPLSFDYGLYQLFLAAQAGAAVFLGRPEQSGPELPSLLATHRVTVLPAVPAQFAGLIKLTQRRRIPLPDLRILTNTGDHLPVAYIEQVKTLFPGVQVFPMYGLTECKRVSILLPEEIEAKPGSVGRPLDGSTAWVRGENGQPLPSGEVGELVVQGPNVAHGYWGAPEETARRFGPRDAHGAGTLYTGDLCRMDDDGFLYFVGRNDSLIKHKGYRISPLEVENAACSLPSVSEAGAVKSSSPDLLHLFVTVRDPDCTATSVLHSLTALVEHFKVPDRVHVLPALPKTGNGKLDRKRLQSMAAEA